MTEAQDNPRVRRTAVLGLVKTVIGSALIGIEFFNGTTHGFVPMQNLRGFAWDAFTLGIYTFGFLLICSAIKNCPFPSGRQ